MINIYCDESCHLENCTINTMALGAIWIDKDAAHTFSQKMFELKSQYGFRKEYEFKWVKISPNHYKIYLDLIQLFLSFNGINFRGVIVPDKSILDHSIHRQSHNEWYYKMHYVLLKQIITNDIYNIYLDYRGIHDGVSAKKLHDVLCNKMYDFTHSRIKKIQSVISNQVQLIQLADVLTGALSYDRRGLTSNAGKLSVIDAIKEQYGNFSTSPLYQKKFNLLVWRPNAS